MKRPLCMVCLAFILSVFLILEYGSPPTDEFSKSVGENKIVTGLVYAKEFSNDKLVIYLKNVTVSNIYFQNFPKTNQKIICYVEELQVIKLGSFIQLRGSLNIFDKPTNPGGFDARQYYATLGIGAKLEKAVILNQTNTYSKRLEFLYELKTKLSDICDEIFNSTQSSVMKAMLLGEKKELDKDTKSLYQKSGISHILSISGLHISIIGMGLYEILKKLKVPLIVRILFAIIVMYHYGLMIGMGSSAYRAIFMFAVKLSANLAKRTYDMITALTVSALFLLLEQPLYVYNSGFLLSFGAILAIGLFLPVLEQLYHGMKKKRFYKWFLSPFFITLSVSLVTFPILLISFYEFAPYSLLINHL